MRRRLAYLASPIDFAGCHDGVNILRREIKDELVSRGWAVYDPGAAFTIGQGESLVPDGRVWKTNWAAMQRADAMVAIVMRDVVTVGTPMEIERMRGEIPIVVAGDAAETSWALQAPSLALLPASARPPEVVGVLNQLVDEWDRNTGGWRGHPMAIKVDEGGQMPTRGYEGDAGFDLYVSDTVEIGPGEGADVPCGVFVEMPPGIWGMIVGRSSTIRRRELLVNSAIIDNGYRGELFTHCTNIGRRLAVIEKGERLAQLIPMHLAADHVRMIAVEQLQPSERGVAGFGSTGA